ncbi:hypothetical protein GQ43DRAFT_444935 [Delitschia confertaspora ATCC 74209]|uniref:Uncharacterized protein n=1 Tax=Delitschia confertaspora ATCC 74209 TaxID=1513339 RepID=A0A9P4JC83_9PLEO|nr:hypothetical protein GQ43DRAFT_444935 [Delitschia confertaspora ATCC 74209]
MNNAAVLQALVGEYLQALLFLLPFVHPYFFRLPPAHGRSNCYRLGLSGTHVV